MGTALRGVRRRDPSDRRGSCRDGGRRAAGGRGATAPQRRRREQRDRRAAAAVGVAFAGDGTRPASANAIGPIAQGQGSPGRLSIIVMRATFAFRPKGVDRKTAAVEFL